MDVEVVIGFETHVELKTHTKLFCNCPVEYDAPPNSRICPVCTGQPGALPVLNKTAVHFAVRAGLALNCIINKHCRFARKNYFYPDLPKGYQISQYENPFCQNGYLEITGDDGKPYPVGIKRVHLEEDAGKLVHSSGSLESSDFSLVDYNRSSIPLLEIVTDHERNPVRSLQEARAYLEKLRQTIKYVEISDCMIEKGQFRCDVNISLRPRGARHFGNRAEIKNMGSFKFIMEALECEIKRQGEILLSGGEVPQETRLFDETRHVTLPMRSKEDAPDYRYFPDPDLIEVELEQELIERIHQGMPELPDQKVRRLMEDFELPREDVLILTKDRHVSDFFSACAMLCRDRRKLSHWIIKELFRLLHEASIPMEKCPVRPKDFSRLITMVSEGTITEKIGRTILEEIFHHGGAPEEVIKKKGLSPIRDQDFLKKLIDDLLSENPDAVSQVKEGSAKSIHFLIGQGMRKTGGKANPKDLDALIRERLLH